MTSRKRLRPEPNISVSKELDSLLQDERNRTDDDLIRNQLHREHESLANKEKREARKVTTTYERYWKFYSSFYQQWTLTDDSTLFNITDRTSPAMYARPGRLPRNETLQVDFLWTTMIPPKFWEAIADSTASFISQNERVVLPEKTRNRFWELRNMMDFDTDKACEMLSAVFTNHWIIPGGKGAAVDEALMSCLAKDAPKIFIARKPHNTGIRFYLICVRFSRCHKTFCLDILPDLEHAKSLSVSQ